MELAKLIWEMQRKVVALPCRGDFDAGLIPIWWKLHRQDILDKGTSFWEATKEQELLCCHFCGWLGLGFSANSFTVTPPEAIETKWTKCHTSNSMNGMFDWIYIYIYPMNATHPTSSHWMFDVQGMNLSAPFIVQVPPFRAVIEKTLPLCRETRAWSSCSEQGSDESLVLVPILIRFSSFFWVNLHFLMLKYGCCSEHPNNLRHTVPILQGPDPPAWNEDAMF